MSRSIDFFILLVCLISLQVVPAFFAATNHAFLILVILSIILLSSLYLVIHNWYELLFGLLLALPTFVVIWWEGILSVTLQITVSSLLYIVFLLYITRHLMRYLFEAEQVSLDMVYACLCLYLIIGLLWSFIYMSIEIYFPGSFTFSAVEDVSMEGARLLLSKLSYFSYVTLSTLGYGDIAPVSRLARSWAALEAIIGQIYLAVVVARLVGLYSVATSRP